MGHIIERKDHTSISCYQSIANISKTKGKIIELTIAIAFIVIGAFIMVSVQ